MSLVEVVVLGLIFLGIAALVAVTMLGLMGVADNDNLREDD